MGVVLLTAAPSTMLVCFGPAVISLVAAVRLQDRPGGKGAGASRGGVRGRMLLLILH